MQTRSIETASTLPAPVMTYEGTPVYPTGQLITPEDYAAAWRPREARYRVKGVCYFYASFASVFVDSDCGVELEVSAIVDLRPGTKVVSHYRCRLAPDGAEVTIDRAKLSVLDQRLIEAAVESAR